MSGNREPLAGRTDDDGSGTVATKSVSSPLMGVAVLVGYQTARPPLRGPRDDEPPTRSSRLADLTIHAWSSLSAPSSQTRSQGRTKKSEVTTACSSGRRRISAVPVFWSRSFGARRSGRGKGRLVRKGFVLRAVEMASAADGGQTTVMSTACQSNK